jgi:hypothetical protein
MPYYRKRSRSFSRRRSYKKKRTFGKYARKGNFAARVKRVLMKNAETKYYDIGAENLQLYHDMGWGPGPATTQNAIRFNPWSHIINGATKYNRVGDEITPVGIKLRLWLANKLDRPNILYRVIVAIIPKTINAVVTTGTNVDLFAPMNLGTCNSTMCAAIDIEKGIKVLYDRVITNEKGFSAYATGLAGDQDGRECHKMLKLWITRKKRSKIRYEPNGTVINNPLAVYVIPYDSYGTLQTDNICSCAFHMRMYWKDL